jgi:acetylornithine/succinyldiaminopimelate/putrescine aminotransferase
VKGVPDGKAEIIVFANNFHGRTISIISFSTDEQYKDGFGPLTPGFRILPYGDADAVEQAITPHTAAVIVEPIQGEGGSIVPPPEFLPRIRAACDRHDVPLVADEIQSGFCRTGKMFAVEHTSTVPDIMTMSKALGGVGLPISGIAYREALNTWGPGAHIGTFRGHVVAYAAGAAALRFMTSQRLADHSARLGASMLADLKALERDARIVGEVRGSGLMIGVELVEDQSTKKPAPELAARARTLCHQRGLLIEVGGHYANVARFLPPLVITEDLVARAVGIFGDVARELSR